MAEEFEEIDVVLNFEGNGAQEVIKSAKDVVVEVIDNRIQCIVDGRVKFSGDVTLSLGSQLLVPHAEDSAVTITNKRANMSFTDLLHDQEHN